MIGTGAAGDSLTHPESDAGDQWDRILCQVCGEYIEGGFDVAVAMTESDFAHDNHTMGQINAWLKASVLDVR